MKSLAKNLITWLLMNKAKEIAANPNTKLVLVVGGEDRQLYKGEIARQLAGMSEVRVVESLPGYNYKLGIALTLLGQKGGFSGIIKWVKLVFSNSETFKAATFVIAEAKMRTVSDLEYFIDSLKPFAVVVSFSSDKDSVDALIKSRLNVKGLIFIPEQFRSGEAASNIFYFGKSAGSNICLKSIEDSEDGQLISFRVTGIEGTAKLNSFGPHYAYSYLIAKHINEQI